VLTGALDDGASGLVAIKREGGLAIVQDPETAAFPSMPRAAIAYVDVDACLPVTDLASKIVALTKSEAPMPETRHDTSDLEREVNIARLDLTVIKHDQEQRALAPMTCPECHGPLWEIADGGPLRYRCRVGHAYTAESMETSLARVTEDTLWTTLNTLEESAKLCERLVAQGAMGSDHQRERHFTQVAQDYRVRAGVIRKLLENGSITKIPEKQE
jgi:two-component system chemotaxis response regulator CheB